MKEQVKINEKENYIAHSLTGILDIIICLLLFISSIYKGAFYKSDFLFPNAIISFVGVIYLVYKVIKEIGSKKDVKAKSKLKILLDTCMLFLPICYALPIVFNTYVSLPDSIYEMLRYVDMTVIYFIVHNTKNEKLYLNAFVGIAFIQMLLGIDQLTFRNFETFLNEISTGYLNDVDRLSATIQYANVTGIVITLGTLICFNKITQILEKEEKTKYIELIPLVFVTLLGFFAVTLTKSRVVAVVTLGLMVIESIICFSLINKKIGIYKLLLIIYSTIVSGVLEKTMLQKEYTLIYVYLAIFAVILVIAYEAVCKLIKYMAEKTKACKRFNKQNKWYFKILGMVVIICILVIGLLTPKDMKLSSLNGEYVKVTRTLYDFKKGKNDIEFNVKTLEEDTRYTVEIREVGLTYGDYNVATYNYFDNTSGNFKSEINIHEDIRKVIVNISVQKGSIEINKFKLNNKNVTLSYKFIPDSIMFKIKDTFSGVYGDNLRLAYVKDTFKLFKKNPVIGIGGEGFKHTYASVQDTGYVSSEAHSAILQTLVEVGALGTSVLLGIIFTCTVISFKILLRMKKIDEKDLRYGTLLVLLYLALLSSVIFDLAFSYAFMIYVFAVICALLINFYMKVIKKYEISEPKKAIIDWSYVRLVALSLSVVVFSLATYFSFNAYRASLIKLPNKEKNEELTVTDVAANIAYLELKNKQDRFDIDYMSDLNKEYTKYKSILTKAYVSAANDKKLKEEINEEIKNTLIRIKENTDKMLEYEYYNKYVLNEVADVYIYNFVKFADIYKEQFSSEEVAYSFYLNYAIKLMDRIIELNPHSEKANDMYIDMCKSYIEELEKDDKYLSSKAIKKTLESLKSKLQERENVENN